MATIFSVAVRASRNRTAFGTGGPFAFSGDGKRMTLKTRFRQAPQRADNGVVADTLTDVMLSAGTPVPSLVHAGYRSPGSGASAGGSADSRGDFETGLTFCAIATSVSCQREWQPVGKNWLS
jgi:hypothetical protein